MIGRFSGGRRRESERETPWGEKKNSKESWWKNRENIFINHFGVCCLVLRCIDKTVLDVYWEQLSSSTLSGDLFASSCILSSLTLTPSFSPSPFSPLLNIYLPFIPLYFSLPLPFSFIPLYFSLTLLFLSIYLSFFLSSSLFLFLSSSLFLFQPIPFSVHKTI